MERDQREDSVFPGKGPEGGFRRDGKEMLGINHQEIEHTRMPCMQPPDLVTAAPNVDLVCPWLFHQIEQYNLLHRLSAQLRVTRTGRHGKHAEKLDLYLISGEQRKQEVPSYEIVCETLDYLRSLGLIDDDDDLYEFLKKFPGVLIGCSLEHELRSDTDTARHACAFIQSQETPAPGTK
ncbi:hypothetical protein NC651_040255 [Populus alba x Populus x berolinensis]|nr:hypothetical protein NC651_040255 [Populus alba x Populus x berolinensis]